MEEWKAIEGYEGYYEVSSSGRVKSLERTVKRSDGQVRKLNSRIISGSFDTDGYRQCKLSKNGKYLTVNIHRLVAQAFIPNPHNLPEVNHKNFNRTDNRVENLEWVSHNDNVAYSIKAGRHFCTRDLTGDNNPNYGNDALKRYYKENPAEAKRILSRPRGQNGKAKKIRIIDGSTNAIVGEYGCIIDCAEAFILIVSSKSKPQSMTYRISLAAKNGTLISGYKFEFVE